VTGILFFYDIPIYRLPEDAYYADRDDYVDATMYGQTPGNNPPLVKIFNTPDVRNSLSVSPKP